MNLAVQKDMMMFAEYHWALNISYGITKKKGVPGSYNNCLYLLSFNCLLYIFLDINFDYSL